MSKYFKLGPYKNWISTEYQKRPVTTLAVGAGIALLIVFLFAMAAIRSFTPNPQRTTSPVLPLATSTIQPTIPAVTPMPTAIPQSIEWKVIKNDEVVKVGKYNYAVVTFQNVGDGTLKKGQCQQPILTIPENGHLYNLVNTFHSEKADYWLFIPIEGVNNSTFQRFAPIQ